MFVDAGKENEYHNMSTDGWKELRATAENGLDEFTGHFETPQTEIMRGDGDEGYGFHLTRETSSLRLYNHLSVKLNLAIFVSENSVPPSLLLMLKSTPSLYFRH